MNEKNLEIGAAYIRVSTDDQTELSPDAQLRVILEAAKKDGIVIPQEFVLWRIADVLAVEPITARNFSE